MVETQKPAADPPVQAQAEAAGFAPKLSFWRRRPVILVGTLALGLFLIFGLSYLAEGFTHESTDDAFLDAHIVSIAPKVAGLVDKVQAVDNQFVPAGQLLVEIDPRDLQVELDRKRAAVNAARANVDVIKATVELFRSEIATAEATAKQSAAEAAASQAKAERAGADLKRAQELIANHTISPQEFDSARADAMVAEASLSAARQKAASDESKVAQSQAQLGAGVKGYERAEAQTREAELEARTAELNLSYARISAPEAGRVTKKAVEQGNYVQVGQSLMALVPNQLYVTANFKESQLAGLRTNQRARLRIDAVPERTFAGHVDSVQAGSGARFSLLPPENAVGNYVKVVQRVPVKLVFDEPLPADRVLGPGMSVVPSVRVTGFEISQAVVALAAGLGTLILGVTWWAVAGRR
ncbi:MAG TPA: HlyD family secretion protein [Candidatus Acidoferrum sp.]|jgi:membrane fusion protein (multidrug efflux system)|nr:HlyD family secretion protein [Candidatus Acidoferrum sp.]